MKKSAVLLSCALLFGKAQADLIDAAKDVADYGEKGLNVVKKFIDFAHDAADFLNRFVDSDEVSLEAPSDQPNDPDGCESDMDSEIEQFFKTYNHSSEDADHEILIGVHDLGSESSIVLQPLLHPHSNHAPLPSSAGNAESINFISGGNRAANSEEMETALSTIKKGTVYAHLISLETVSPLSASALKQVQTWGNQINIMNVLSSEMAATNASGPAPRKQRTRAYMKEKALVLNEKAEDMIHARSLCLKYGNTNFPVYNVASTLLKRLGIKNEIHSRLFLNITGTIVSKNQNTDTYPPLHRQVLALLQSGAPVQKAYDTNLHFSELKLSDPSEKEKISLLLDEILQKLDTDEKLSQDATELLEKTSFPIGSWITLMTHYKGKGAKIALDRYANLLGRERAMQFVADAAREMLHAAQSLRASQIDSCETDAYIVQVQEVLDDLQALKNEHHKQQAAEDRALEQMIRLDEKLRNSEAGL